MPKLVWLMRDISDLSDSLRVDLSSIAKSSHTNLGKHECLISSISICPADERNLK